MVSCLKNFKIVFFFEKIKGWLLHNNNLMKQMNQFDTKWRGSNETEEDIDAAHSLSVIHREVDNEIKRLRDTILTITPAVLKKIV